MGKGGGEEMTKKNWRLVLALMSSTLCVTSLVLSFVFFGWKLALILFLALFSQNISNDLAYKGE